MRDENDTPGEDEPKVYGHQAASDFLAEHGYTISRKSLLNRVSIGGGPYFYKWGSRVVYLEADLLAWAKERWRPCDE